MGCRMFLFVVADEHGNPEINELDLGDKIPDNITLWLKKNPTDYKMLFRSNDDETAFELVDSNPMDLDFYLSALRELKNPDGANYLVFTNRPYKTFL